MKETNTSAVEKNNDTKPSDNENVVNQTADSGNDTPDSVPYARFNEMNKKYQTENKALQDKLDSILAKEEEAKIKNTNDLTEAKTKLAEYHSQIQELTSYKEQIQERDAKEHQKLLEQIPEDVRDSYGKLPLEDLQNIISKQVQKANVQTDKSAPMRDSFKVKDSDDIWKMDKDSKKKNWSDIVNFYKNKK
jgi:dTDP-4-amino-4,6-dideoxygalactose transaminase